MAGYGNILGGISNTNSAIQNANEATKNAQTALKDMGKSQAEIWKNIGKTIGASGDAIGGYFENKQAWDNKADEALEQHIAQQTTCT